MSLEVGKIPKETPLAASAVENLRSTSPEWPPLMRVTQVYETLSYMPEGKSGIVLGSGPNTSAWKDIGWKTLDVDHTVSPDYIADANYLEQYIERGSVDFIFAENIRMDPSGSEGVIPENMIKGASEVLKMGGVFTVYTADFSDTIRVDSKEDGFGEVTIPDYNEFARVLRQHGFDVTVLLEPMEYVDEEAIKNKDWSQRVWYISTKIAEGYDPDRVNHSGYYEKPWLQQTKKETIPAKIRTLVRNIFK